MARKLKYYTPDTDYRALERELSGAGTEASEDDFEYESYPAEDDDDWEPDR